MGTTPIILLVICAGVLAENSIKPTLPPPNLPLLFPPPQLEELVIMVEARGSDGSTLVQFLGSGNSHLIARKDPFYKAIEIDQAESSPDLIFDPLTNTSFYIFPSDVDSRTPSYEIEDSFILHQMASSNQRLKFAVVISHTQLEYGNKNHVLSALRTVSKLIKNPAKFKNSLLLIVTRVDSQDSTPEVRRSMGAVLRNIREDLVGGGKNGGIVQVLDAIVPPLEDGAEEADEPKIGIMRVPLAVGPLTSIPAMQEAKQELTRFVHSNAIYAEVKDANFEFSWTPQAIPIVNQLADQISQKLDQEFDQIGALLEYNIKGQIDQSNSNSIDQKNDNLSSILDPVTRLKMMTVAPYNPLKSSPSSLLKPILTQLRSILTEYNSELDKMEDEMNKLDFLEKGLQGQGHEIIKPYLWLKSLTGHLESIIENGLTDEWTTFIQDYVKSMTQVNIQIAGENSIKDDEYLGINKTSFRPFCALFGSGHPCQDLFASLEVNEEVKLDAVNSVYRMTLLNLRKFTTEGADDSILIVEDNFLAVSEVLKKIDKTKIRSLILLAHHTIFIDQSISGIDFDPVNNLDLTIIAPHWRILGRQSINLNGSPGAVLSTSGDNCEHGRAGQPGGRAGNFVGFSLTVQGETAEGHLTVTSNGGAGSDGKNGQHGHAGTTTSDVNLEKVTCTSPFMTIDPSDYTVDSGYENPSFSCNKVTKGTECGPLYLRPVSTGVVGQNGVDGGIGGSGGQEGILIFSSMNQLSPQTVTLSEPTKGQNGQNGKGGQGGLSGVTGRGRTFNMLINFHSHHNSTCQIIPGDWLALSSTGIPARGSPGRDGVNSEGSKPSQVSSYLVGANEKYIQKFINSERALIQDTKYYATGLPKFVQKLYGDRDVINIFAKNDLAHLQINDGELPASTAKNNLAGETIEFLHNGSHQIQPSPTDEIVMVLGKSGTGKSTMVSILTQQLNDLQAEKQIRTRFFLIKDKQDKINTVTTFSKTIIPDLMIDFKTNTSYYDCPGFADNRGTKIEIANSYFIRQVALLGKKIKFILVVNYNSVSEGAGRQEFLDSLKQLSDFIINPAKFKNSLLLIVNRVPPTCKQAEIIAEIGGYLEQVKVEQENFGGDSGVLELLNIFLESGDDNDAIYRKIGILRNVNKLGPLNENGNVEQDKINLENIIHKNSNFVQKHEKDFKSSLSDSAKLTIDDLVEKLGQNFQQRFNCLGNSYLNYSHTGLDSLTSNGGSLNFQKNLKILLTLQDFYQTGPTENPDQVLAAILKKVKQLDQIDLAGECELTKMEDEVKYLKFFKEVKGQLNIDINGWVRPLSDSAGQIAQYLIDKLSTKVGHQSHLSYDIFSKVIAHFHNEKSR